MKGRSGRRRTIEKKRREMKFRKKKIQRGRRKGIKRIGGQRR